MHVQNVLIVAHDNGATLTVIVGSDECAMVTVNVGKHFVHSTAFENCS